MRSYAREEDVCDKPCRPVSQVGVLVQRGSDRFSLLVAATGGATAVHAHSAVALDDQLVLGVCDSLVCLDLPTLETRWVRRADFATVFGVWWWAEGSRIVVHGEMEISCWTVDGTCVWSAGGADIFSEGFELQGDTVWAKDFEGRTYRWSLSDGALLP